MGQHISWKLAICFTQVTPDQGNRADVTNDSDGAGSRATAGCTRRKNSRAAAVRAAPVEPEGELVEVVGQMCVRDRAMMRPK